MSSSTTIFHDHFTCEILGLFWYAYIWLTLVEGSRTLMLLAHTSQQQHCVYHIYHIYDLCLCHMNARAARRYIWKEACEFFRWSDDGSDRQIYLNKEENFWLNIIIILFLTNFVINDIITTSPHGNVFSKES